MGLSSKRDLLPDKGVDECLVSYWFYMMTLAELQNLIQAGESQTLELKQSTGQRSRAMETLSPC